MFAICVFDAGGERSERVVPNQPDHRSACPAHAASQCSDVSAGVGQEQQSGNQRVAGYCLLIGGKKRGWAVLDGSP